MSGTSSTQPGPTEAAPLTPEQRKAYAEIGAALATQEKVRKCGHPLGYTRTCYYCEMERK